MMERHEYIIHFFSIFLRKDIKLSINIVYWSRNCFMLLFCWKTLLTMNNCMLLFERITCNGVKWYIWYIVLFWNYGKRTNILLLILIKYWCKFIWFGGKMKWIPSNMSFYLWSILGIETVILFWINNLHSLIFYCMLL